MSPTTNWSAPPSTMRDRLFGQLKHHCAACLAEPSIETIAAFRQFLDNPELTSALLKPLTAYLVCPFRVIIENVPKIVQSSNKPTSSKQLILKSLDCLDVLLTKIAAISCNDTFDALFSMYLCILGQDDTESSRTKDPSKPLPPKLVPHLTDDLNLMLLRCFHSLLIACYQPLITVRMQQNEFQFKLGYLINLLIKLVQKPKQNREIVQRSLNLLTLIYLKSLSVQSNTDAVIEINDNDASHGCAVQFTGFTLPSIASVISKLMHICAGADYHKLHQSVIVSGLDLFGIVLEIVFNSRQTFPEKAVAKSNTSQIPMNVQFDQNWFDETTKRLSPILSSTIAILIEHPRQEVRNSLLKLSSRLLLHSCLKFTQSFITILFRVPVAYYDVPECQQFIAQFQNHIVACSLEDSISLTNILHEELFTHIKRLPFVFRRLHLDGSMTTNSSDNLQSSFQTLAGFITILKPDGFYQFLKIDQHKYQLFRSLINLSEFNFSTKLECAILDLDKSATTLSQSTRLLDQFDTFELEKHLVYLTDKSLLRCYLECGHQIATCINYRSFQIIYDHLLQLLHHSDFDPSVLLLFNILLTGLHSGGRNMSPQFEPYLLELLPLYRQHLDLSQLYFIQEEVEQQTGGLLPLSNLSSSQGDTLKSVPLSSLVTICSPINGHQSNSLEALEKSKPKANRLNRNIMRHCLLLQGTALCYTLLHQLTSGASKYQSDFFRTSFCHYLEAYSCEHQLIASVASRMLLFIGDRFQCGSGGDVSCMVADNLDYVYNSLVVTLDHSVLLDTKGSSVVGSELDALYRVDRYSLTTVQVALETILKLLKRLHISKKGNINLNQLDYMHRLVDQILNIVKYYSIRPLARYASSLNQLLTILYAYLELVEAVCDVNSKRARRIEHDENRWQKIETTIGSLEEYIENFYFYQDQWKADFKKDIISKDIGGKNKVTAQVDDEQQAELEKRAILDAPVIKSRTGHILHHCSLIMSDANVNIRMNVLQLASKSMFLLRSYEDILLPYVHNLWEPLVARFSTESDHPVILSRAYSCLLLASEFCGDFLLARTRKDILPKLATFLQSQLDNRIAYYNTHKRIQTVKSVEYFAEHELLGSIGQLMVNLKLKSNDLWSICPLLLMYLALKPIPMELQKRALDSLVEMARYDAGSVRFYLHRMINLYYYDAELNRSNESDVSKRDCHSCDCHRFAMRHAECITKWRRYFHLWQNSLVKDLKSYLQSL